MSRRKKKEEPVPEEAAPRKRALFIVSIILLASLGGGLSYWIMGQHSGIEYGDGGGEDEPVEGPYAPGTHMVMAELFVTGSCPSCDSAAGDLAFMKEERSDFYFVTLMIDPYVPLNRDVMYRFYQIGNRNGSVPDMVFDGGRRSVIGALGESAYAEGIDVCKDMPVPETSITGSAQMMGNTVVKGHVDIEVKGTVHGYVRAFLVEKESRQYYDRDGNPLKNVFIGYALNESVDISPENGYSSDFQWEGNEIVPGNVALVVALYDENGWAIQAYMTDV